MGRRSLFIHAGLHKTGTTALQTALASNSDWIAGYGYRFPRSGQPWAHSGHHNIAWEITQDRRFRTDNGTASDLIAELDGGDDHVILSSEDFTGAIANGDRFRDFIRAFKNIFTDVWVVIFLRNQADYATSLYLELLAHGLAATFDSFMDEIAMNGALRWREWCFPFDFQEFLSKIDGIPELRLKVCSYDACKNGALLRAFLEACELSANSSAPISLPKENTRRAVGWYIAQFLRNRGWPKDEFQTLILDCMQEACARNCIALSAIERQFIVERFTISNAHVSTTYNVPINEFMNDNDLDDSRNVGVSCLFSEELLEFCENLSHELRSEADEISGSRKAIDSIHTRFSRFPVE